MSVIRCGRCQARLPWTGRWPEDGTLCVACLRRWLEDQRTTVPAVEAVPA